MKQFLILGGESRLARCFKSLYSNDCVVLNKNQCDITEPPSLENIIKNINCFYVLNCAAVTDTDECEKNPLHCFSVNVIAVYYLNKLCLKYKKKLIHISSNATTNPSNMYGWSKFLSEKMVHPHALIIRTDFYDRDTYIVKNLMQQKPTKAYSNVYFNPISANHLAYQIYTHKNSSGIINIFTNKKISFFEFAQEFCDVFGLDKPRLVKSMKFKNTSNHTPRPLNLFVKSTINRSIIEDLIDFKQYISKNDY